MHKLNYADIKGKDAVTYFNC